MKHVFVLDENIITLAHKGQNEKGDEDLSAAKLVVDIAYNCHNLAINSQIWTRYSRKIGALKRSRRSVKGVNVLNVLSQMMVDTTKAQFLSSVRIVPDRYQLHAKDAPFVNVAATVRGILVTTDDKLRNKLNQPDIFSQYGIRAVRPEDAIPLAESGDP